MEVGKNGFRYSFEVNPFKTDVNPVNTIKLIDGGLDSSKEDLTVFEDSTIVDAYASDSETSSSGFTDGTNSLLPSSDPAPSRLIGIEEDLIREVGVEVHDLTEFGSIPKFIDHRIRSGYEVASFLVTNLATVIGQYKQWKAELPMVVPFYAVKCNPDPVILRLLSYLGCNFDCATMGEIDMVVNGLGDDLSFGSKNKAAQSIVYANPAKMSHMLEFAIAQGVRMTVFDGEDELQKIASIPGHENLELLLRLTTDDKASICRFSKKFGCPVEEAPALLKVAKELGLNVAGVSFHVGSGCGDAMAYVTAIEHARIVFEEGKKLGFMNMHIVDIGGGFPGDSSGYGGEGMPTFPDLAAAIRQGVTHFLASFADGEVPENMRFIAEPGRYFVSASTTISTKIYSRKGGKNSYQALYVDDGVYGSFNNVVYDHATPVPLKLNDVLEATAVVGKKNKTSCSPSPVKPVAPVEMMPSAVFGPTCDGLDQMCSLETTTLPRCEVGDWLIWESQGAYTHTASFVFNGYTHVPKKTYCYL